ncbi:uncharacterized protein N7498_006053 [Penicillium cinerascens]|uniref:PIN domain-containing protein n=1 Tax=Penicillium cinerascens TaxID=70096 RepID=A0A9W9MHG7_9EURO|nr:uncharacterized protein N7498_006053 [Penicillium cinerascens]KAJ5201390.1 hypothetical protein N7498_006053 [Penicillium cinerascens]
MSTGRKTFHCAVDETALTTNISEIKKWTTSGAIDLIVPLYTLERLHALKRAGSQIAINAREAVRFLDRVTSGKDHIAADRVALQGPMEQYEHWEEAEKFFLPEFEEEPEALDETASPESATDSPKYHGASESDDLSQMLLSKLNFKNQTEAPSITSAGSPSGPGSRTSSRSSRTSPECAQHENGGTGKMEKTKGHQRASSASNIPVVPSVLRPLLSALLWRLHSGPDAENSAKSCILVTNDRATQVWAQKFGIGVKNIVQLRTAIQYEEREYKNRCKYVEKTQTHATEPKTLLTYEDDSDEDELVFVPRGRGSGSGSGSGNGKGSSSRGARGGSSRKNAAAKATPATPETQAPVEVPTQPIDPDSFSRSLGANKTPTVDLSSPQGAARGMSSASRRSASSRRGGSTRGAARGNGRGRGKLWVP